MIPLYSSSFTYFILIDLAVFLTGLYLATRFFSVRLNHPATAALFSAQIFVLLWAGFTPLSGLELEIKPANIKFAEIYTSSSQGINYDAHQFGKAKSRKTRETLYLTFPSSDGGEGSFLLKIGEKPRVFTVTSIDFFADLPVGKRRISHVAGSNLRPLLSPVNPFINLGTYNHHGITNIPRDKKEPAWFKINLGTDAREIIRKYSGEKSILLMAFSWAFVLGLAFLFVITLPSVISLALAHARGSVKSTKSKLAYSLLNFSIILLITFVLLLIAEFTTRYYYRDVLSTPTTISYFHLKHEQQFLEESNPLKFRGKRFSIEKTDKFRIVVMGDSFSWGQGVYPYTRRFPELLEKKLHKKYGNNIEVINLGVAGLDLPQYAAFQPFVISLKPDFVLYQWYINDMDVTPSKALYKKPHLIPIKSWHEYLYKHSALYYVLERGMAQAKALFGSQTSYTDHLINTYKDPDSIGYKKAMRALKKVLNGFQKNDIPFGIVLFPDTGSKQPMSSYRLGFLHKMVLDECESRHATCLDLTKSYSVFDNDMQKTWANVFDAHPSEAVHKLAAQKIFQTYDPVWKQMLENNFIPQ